MDDPGADDHCLRATGLATSAIRVALRYAQSDADARHMASWCLAELFASVPATVARSLDDELEGFGAVCLVAWPWLASVGVRAPARTFGAATTRELVRAVGAMLDRTGGRLAGIGPVEVRLVVRAVPGGLVLAMRARVRGVPPGDVRHSLHAVRRISDG